MRVSGACVGLTAAVALCAAGCGSEPDVGEEVGQVELAQAVCAAGEVVPGIDVSYYQGNIDWNAVAGDGIAFAIARVNHGSFMDPEFGDNWAGIRQVGMVRGAYQYFNPGGDPVEQATILIDAIGALEPGDLPPVLDVESTDGKSPATVAANVGTWLDLVEGALGRRPIIYTGSYFWNDNVGTDEYNDHPLWIAHYTTNCPNMPNAWPNWAMWQYTSSGSVSGIAGNVDRDRFNGPMEALQDMAANGYRAKLVSLDYPTVMAPGESAEVTLVVENLGARSWDADTKLGTTEPRDRASAFESSGWDDANRVLSIGDSVAHGETVELTFSIVAPAEKGDYVEHFNLVQESVAWFSDIQPGGGPDDAAIALSIEVTGDPLPSGSGSGVGGGQHSSGSGQADADAAVDGALHGQVSCQASPARHAGQPWLAWLGLAAAFAATRRRRPI